MRFAYCSSPDLRIETASMRRWWTIFFTFITTVYAIQAEGIEQEEANSPSNHPVGAFDGIKDRSNNAPALSPHFRSNPRTLSNFEILPREIALGNPDYARVRLSDDGRYLSYLAPWNNVMNLYVRHIPEKSTPKRLTNDTKRGIEKYQVGYTWMSDNRTIIYAKDDDGDENFRLYAVDVETSETRILTNTTKVKVVILAVSWKQPDLLIIGLNDRNPSYHDAYALNVKTGEKRLIFKNDQFSDYRFDKDMRLRILMKEHDNASFSYYAVSDDGESWKLMKTIGRDESYSTDVFHFDDTGRILYWVDSIDRDLGALISENVDTGERKVIYEPERSDISFMPDPVTGKPLAVTEEYMTPERIVLDKSVEPDFKLLDKIFPTSWKEVVSMSLDMKIWLVVTSSDKESFRYYLYNRTKADESQSIVYLLSYNTKLENYTLASMHAVEVPISDGLREVCYYVLPLESDPDQTGRPNFPLPTILSVHGGPWSRVIWGLNTEMQAWASRGYAVLTCNFRGSWGYGKNFLNAGNRQWGGKMQNDLTDAVRWAVKHHIADPEKVAIMGTSYGGYATLAGMAFTPDVYACGVDIVGPSNLETFMKSIPPYWQPVFETYKYRLGGDPYTEEGKAFLEKISPLYSVEQIRKPLLIAHGANDPRVNRNESDQIVEVLKKNSVGVTYVVFPDEGHGFARSENRLAFFAIAEKFLAHCLGGKAEPIGNALNGSTATFEEAPAAFL